MVAVDDQLRGLGAVVDMLVSCALFALAFVIMAVVPAGDDGSISLGLAVGILLFCWVLDVLVYAIPVSAFGWSIGNLLTKSSRDRPRDRRPAQCSAGRAVGTSPGDEC